MPSKSRGKRARGKQPSAPPSPAVGPSPRPIRSRTSRPVFSRWLRRNRSFVIGTLAIAVVLSILAFGIAQATTSSSTPGDFQFSLYQGEDILGGSQLNFSDVLQQGRPVILNFWAGNCPPCRFEMPDLQRSYEEYKDRVVFLGLDVGIFTGLGTRQDALNLLRELNITYPAGAPPNGRALRLYNATSMPTTVFFNAEGNVFRTWPGSITRKQMGKVIEDMLRAS